MFLLPYKRDPLTSCKNRGTANTDLFLTIVFQITGFKPDADRWLWAQTSRELLCVTHTAENGPQCQSLCTRNTSGAWSARRGSAWRMDCIVFLSTLGYAGIRRTSWHNTRPWISYLPFLSEFYSYWVKIHVIGSVCKSPSRRGSEGAGPIQSHILWRSVKISFLEGIQWCHTNGKLLFVIVGILIFTVCFCLAFPIGSIWQAMANPPSRGVGEGTGDISTYSESSFSFLTCGIFADWSNEERWNDVSAACLNLLFFRRLTTSSCYGIAEKMSLGQKWWGVIVAAHTSGTWSVNWLQPMWVLVDRFTGHSSVWLWISIYEKAMELGVPTIDFEKRLQQWNDGTINLGRKYMMADMERKQVCLENIHLLWLRSNVFFQNLLMEMCDERILDAEDAKEEVKIGSQRLS